MPRVWAAVPPLPSAPALRSCSPAVRRWKVVHAAETLPRVLVLTAAQAEAGMFPSLLTASGWLHPGAPGAPPAALTLIEQWRQVCRWRGLLRKEDVRHAGDLFHAHCLSAAIVALRSELAVVYDLGSPVTWGHQTKPGPCALRSLAVAEGLVLRRATAVVAHSRATWNWALRKGVRAEDLFLVPEPVELAEISELPTSADAGQMWGTGPGINFFAPAVADAATLELLLRAFSVLAGEIEDVRLLVETTPELSSTLAERAAAEELAGVRAIAPDEREAALASADAVIAGDGPGPSAAAIAAFSCGRALLAADVAANREVTSSGRGCLWFRRDSARDLAFRAAFLARNPDLRAALGRAGRAHLESTRGPRAVAEAYDEIYAHARARQRRGARPPMFGEAPALQAG